MNCGRCAGRPLVAPTIRPSVNCRRRNETTRRGSMVTHVARKRRVTEDVSNLRALEH